MAKAKKKFYEMWWFWTIVFWPYALFRFGVPWYADLRPSERKLVNLVAAALLGPPAAALVASPLTLILGDSAGHQIGAALSVLASVGLVLHSSGATCQGCHRSSARPWLQPR